MRLCFTKKTANEPSFQNPVMLLRETAALILTEPETPPVFPSMPHEMLRRFEEKVAKTAVSLQRALPMGRYADILRIRCCDLDGVRALHIF